MGITLGQKPMMTRDYGMRRVRRLDRGAPFDRVAFNSATAGSVASGHFRGLSGDVSIASMWS